MPKRPQLPSHGGLPKARLDRLSLTKTFIDFLVEIGLVVMVVSESAVDLSERELGMLSLDLIGVPVVRDPLKDDLDHLGLGPRDDRPAFWGNLDVWIDRRRHGPSFARID